MESNAEFTEALRRADRAAAAPYIDYPPTPRWYPPAFGVWSALLCLAIGISDNHGLRAAMLCALVAVELAFVAWYRRYRGTWPRGHAPQELRRIFVGFVFGAALVVGVLGLTLWLTEPWVAAILALVIVTPAIAWYERVYADAAARARTRLG